MAVTASYVVLGKYEAKLASMCVHRWLDLYAPARFGNQLVRRLHRFKVCSTHVMAGLPSPSDVQL
jgi:hypothetical protein